MNKIHLIGPLLLTAAFVPCYIHFAQLHAAQEAAARAVEERHRIEEELLRDRREQEAFENVRQAQLARDAAMAEKERQRRADLAEKNAVALGQLTAATSAATSEAATNQSLHSRLEQLRATRLTTERESFELSRDLEFQQIDRRNLDLELQRRMQLVTSALEVAPLLEESFFQDANPRERPPE